MTQRPQHQKPREASKDAHPLENDRRDDGAHTGQDRNAPQPGHEAGSSGTSDYGRSDYGQPGDHERDDNEGSDAAERDESESPQSQSQHFR